MKFYMLINSTFDQSKLDLRHDHRYSRACEYWIVIVGVDFSTRMTQRFHNFSFEKYTRWMYGDMIFVIISETTANLCSHEHSR